MNPDFERWQEALVEADKKYKETQEEIGVWAESLPVELRRVIHVFTEESLLRAREIQRTIPEKPKRKSRRKKSNPR